MKPDEIYCPVCGRRGVKKTRTIASSLTVLFCEDCQLEFSIIIEPLGTNHYVPSTGTTH